MDKRLSELPADLAAVCEQFTQWRAAHKPHSRFPESLWSLAAGLVAKYDPREVCRALQLDYYRLKKHLEPASVADKPGVLPGFVEIRGRQEDFAGRCTVECEHPRGHRIRIHLDGGDLSTLATFCGQLWSTFR